MRESVYALGDVSRYHTEFINQSCPNIKVIGRAYLVGPDNVAHWKNHIAMDVVPAGTKIQGKTVDPKYLPQDNIENKLHIHQDFIEHPETMSGLILTKNITVYQKVQILNMLLREK